MNGMKLNLMDAGQQVRPLDDWTPELTHQVGPLDGWTTEMNHQVGPPDDWTLEELTNQVGPPDGWTPEELTHQAVTGLRGRVSGRVHTSRKCQWIIGYI